MYISNRFLTLVKNILLGHKLSEYHTGYWAFSREILERLPLDRNSDDFVFDNQMLAQIVWFGYRIGEFPVLPSTSRMHPRSISGGAWCMA